MGIRSSTRGSRRLRGGRGSSSRGSEMFKLFARAGANLQVTAEHVYELMMSWPESRDLRSEITRCEQEGDRITRQIIQRLHQSRLAPSRSQGRLRAGRGRRRRCRRDRGGVRGDGAVRHRGAGRAGAAARRRRPGLGAGGPAGARAALDLPDLQPEAQQMRELEHEGDRIYREAIASLFDHGIDPMVILRWKDVFQGLEDATDRRDPSWTCSSGWSPGTPSRERSSRRSRSELRSRSSPGS